MYAMDHTLHTEHRSDERRSRWDWRRAGTAASTSTATIDPVAANTITEVETAAVHQFLD
jgi:hypothetical protein